MTALAGVELESLVSEPDALTTRPPPCARCCNIGKKVRITHHSQNCTTC